MKRLLLATAAATLLLSSSAAFSAPDKHDRHDHDRADHRDDRRDDRDDYRDDTRHDNGRHLGQQRQAWRRGDRLPAIYRTEVYYVSDYRSHRLAPPPRGYRWVRPYRDDSEYLLIEISTGLISRIFGG
jgi:Ni/Co efflux regulator RcnB